MPRKRRTDSPGNILGLRPRSVPKRISGVGVSCPSVSPLGVSVVPEGSVALSEIDCETNAVVGRVTSSSSPSDDITSGDEVGERDIGTLVVGSAVEAVCSLSSVGPAVVRVLTSVVVESSVDEVSSVTSDIAAFVRLSTSVFCLVIAVDEPLERAGVVDGVEMVLGRHSILNGAEFWPTNVFS